MASPLMDRYFESIAASRTLSAESAQHLVDCGFVIIPGPVGYEQRSSLGTAYDDAMERGKEPDFRTGSTTTRLHDMVNRGPAFDDIYLHPPLLEACSLVICEPFKLSSFLARTLRPGSPAQELHVDLRRDSTDGPMVGFILMIDPFTTKTGATRIVPSSQNWQDVPHDRLADTRSSFPGEVAACGAPGSLIIFNGAVWHGHTANSTSQPRRSLQGYFVRREVGLGFDFAARMQPQTLDRLSDLARYLLSLSDSARNVKVL